MMSYYSRQATSISTLSCIICIIFPVFRIAKAFSSARIKASSNFLVRSRPHGSLQHINKSMHQSSTGGTINIMTILASQNSPSTSNDNDVCVRILCLHGKGGNGPKFVNSSLKPLRALVDKRAAVMSNSPNQNDKILDHRLSFHWEDLTAPYELLSGEDAGGYMWWTMPDGVRSYNAQEYEGFDESEALVMERLFPTESKTSNFDIILGHSQGAMLTAALLSIQERLRNTKTGPMGYILNGVAWPNPLSRSLLSLAQETPSAIDQLPRIVFIMGMTDTINPIESAMQVHDSYKAARFDASIVYHEGGHSVPLGRDDDSIRALNEVVDWIISIAKEKTARLKADT